MPRIPGCAASVAFPIEHVHEWNDKFGKLAMSFRNAQESGAHSLRDLSFSGEHCLLSVRIAR